MQPTQEILHVLADRGLLLTQDKSLPNVVTLLTGQSLRNSWWSHPKARLIFAVLSDLAQHPDVLFTKLLYGKVTLLHRRLWSQFLAVASAREPWQLRGLSPKAGRLLRTLKAKGSVQASGVGAKELEVRLLAHADEVHTESGRHEIRLEAWHIWSQRVGKNAIPSVSQARRALEEAARELGAPLTALPWRSG